MMAATFRDNAQCHKAEIIYNWFLEYNNEPNVLLCPPQSPELNPAEVLWDVLGWEIQIIDMHLINVKQMQGAFMRGWFKTWFLVEMPQAVLSFECKKEKTKSTLATCLIT